MQARWSCLIIKITSSKNIFVGSCHFRILNPSVKFLRRCNPNLGETTATRHGCKQVLGNRFLSSGPSVYWIIFFSNINHNSKNTNQKSRNTSTTIWRIACGFHWGFKRDFLVSSLPTMIELWRKVPLVSASTESRANDSFISSKNGDWFPASCVVGCRNEAWPRKYSIHLWNIFLNSCVRWTCRISKRRTSRFVGFHEPKTLVGWFQGSKRPFNKFAQLVAFCPINPRSIGQSVF